MLNFFDTLIEYVQIAFQFFLNLIESLANAVLTLTTSLALVTHLTGFAPYFLSASMLICVAVVVLNYIIGRSNQ